MNELEKTYRRKYEDVLKPIAAGIESQLREYLDGELRIDRIAARPKSIDRFLKKAAAVQKDGAPKYSEPLRQIQDQVGARIITFYWADVERVSQIVQKYFRQVESKQLVPDSEWKFGYFGRHFVLITPTDVIPKRADKSLVPEFFELQIKTLFQHAWSEANHDLGYKPTGTPLKGDEERRLAFTSAQAWGADRVFDELFRERNGT